MNYKVDSKARRKNEKREELRKKLLLKNLRMDLSVFVRSSFDRLNANTHMFSAE